MTRTPSDEHRLRLLRGAVTEYLDENLVADFLNDLALVLKEEEKEFINKAKVYGKLYKKLYKENI